MFTTDVDRVVAFYAGLLGREPDAHSEGMAHLRLNGVTLFVSSAARAREEDHTAFSVPDLDAARARLRAIGIEVRGPERYPWGRAAYLLDPDRREIELHEPGAIEYGGHDG